MTDAQEINWERVCWSKRFLNREDSPPCLKPATWRGDPESPVAFVRAWRAC